MQGSSMSGRAVVALGALCAVLGVSGCKGPARSFCEDKVRAGCAYQYRCCEDKERVEQSLRFTFFALYGYTNTEGECVDRNIGLLCSGTFETDESISAGRQEWDQGAADGCLEDLRTATDGCDIEDFLAATDTCANVRTTEPLVDDKDTCALSAECKSGVCDVDVDDDGLAKDVTDEGFAEGECLELPGSGDACPDFQCATGLFCGDQGECEALRGKGDDCDFDQQCEPELFCNDNACDTTEVNLDDKYCTGRD